MVDFNFITVDDGSKKKDESRPSGFDVSQFAILGDEKPKTEPVKQDTGLLDVFTGSGRIAQTPELGTLPEFGATPESQGFKVSLGLLSTFDPQSQIDIIKESIPEAQFETTTDGSTIVSAPTETGEIRRSVLNRPGFSPQDFTTGVAQALAFMPAAAISSLGKNLFQKAMLGATTSGATEKGLQEVGKSLGREEGSTSDIATSALLGAGSELVMPAIQGVRQARRARQIGVESDALEAARAPVSEAQEAIKGLEEATGVRTGLFQAQQTMDPSQLVQQRLLPQLQASSRKAMKQLESQNRQVFDATSELLSTVAGDDVLVTGSERFRSAANRAIDIRKANRSQTASPIYKQAFRRQRQAKTPLIDTGNLEQKISGIIRGSDRSGQVASNLGKIADKIDATGGDLQQLHSVKLEIDNLIEGRGENAIGNVTKRALTDVKNDLVDMMVEQSPSYRAARSEFARLSPEVERVTSLVGKVADLPDDQLKNISGRIFDPRETNPSVLNKVKTVIQDADPGAWNDLLRVEMERRFGGLQTVLNEGGATAANIPGQIDRALFGNPKNRQVLFAAMSEEQKKNFRYLNTVLKRASAGRAAGSPTTPYKEALDKMKGVAGVIRDTIFRPVGTVQSVGEQSLFDRRLAALSEAMFDAQWKPEMKKLRALDSNTPVAARAMAQLLDDIVKQDEKD